MLLFPLASSSQRLSKAVVQGPGYFSPTQNPSNKESSLEETLSDLYCRSTGKSPILLFPLPFRGTPLPNILCAPEPTPASNWNNWNHSGPTFWVMD